ncbi:hypothetical protein RhiirA5_418047 [Rhizophagus irregularis]|uniref:Uncharacterized protein n=1 Tax=Rhizophagus irregularis TaxID=588596 RepID=A0A2I1FIW2_9GLOM|nr:hypothetical protein RhiirA5_418047 [Rhizophagus irregularis]PKC54779.1 hypothetical protein RhiirA1_476681 [Rhizophagus irregularis]PKY34299.1 hypothetical protein RhiirB3_453891 [Rhizophagus irregularis]
MTNQFATLLPLFHKKFIFNVPEGNHPIYENTYHIKSNVERKVTKPKNPDNFEKNRSDSEVHMDYKDDDTNRNNETNDENADGMSSNNLFFIVYYQLFQFFDKRVYCLSQFE